MNLSKLARTMVAFAGSACFGIGAAFSGDGCIDGDCEYGCNLTDMQVQSSSAFTEYSVSWAASQCTYVAYPGIPTGNSTALKWTFYNNGGTTLDCPLNGYPGDGYGAGDEKNSGNMIALVRCGNGSGTL